ncbi:hypothetical protein JW935_22480 [candidate division KSB1 bacterium]|nr:hypothetical protein [candidate division KSB1 bacterium]
MKNIFLLIFTIFLTTGNGQVIKIDTSQVIMPGDRIIKLQENTQKPYITDPAAAGLKIDPSMYFPAIPVEKIQEIRLYACADTHFILLKWPDIEGTKGYNVYRRTAGAQYTKLNATPVKYPVNQKTATDDYEKVLPKPRYSRERLHIRLATKAEFYPQFTDTSLATTFSYLGDIYFQVALVMGGAWADSSVKKGTEYEYKVTYIDKANKELDFTNNTAKLTAGIFPKPEKPTGLTAEAGDSKILLTWNDPPQADSVLGYHVFRATNTAGPFVRCDTIPVLSKLKYNLAGKPLNTEKYGYVDRHAVNNRMYYYYVVPRNPLGRFGPKSSTVSATATDQTPPQIVKNVNITALKTNDLLISWNRVYKDIWIPEPRAEKVEKYYIFRYPDYQTAITDTLANSKYLVATIKESAVPTAIKTDSVRYWNDKVTPEVVYWYRLSCEDSSGNISRKTAAVSGLLPDYTPPDPPKQITAEGFDKHILITWKPPNTALPKNQDLAGYLVYRGICGGYYKIIKRDEGNLKQFIAYPLHLLADVTDKDTLYYKDYSVPEGSPICYRYAVKAYDKPQNISTMSDSVCERLRDKTPPDPPVLTALDAGNKSIKIKCVSPPVQDMKGFIVERADAEAGPYKIVYSDSMAKRVTCNEIPCSVDSVLANKVNQLSYNDRSVEEDKIYWYRVTAFDYSRNKSAPCPPVSTATFHIVTPTKPKVKANTVKNRDGSCGVVLVWDIASRTESMNFKGYAIFKSTAKNGVYRQLGALQKSSRYTDNAVFTNTTYWYRVQTFLKNGDRSPLSDPVSVKL